jgi:hypothetical protein
VIRMPLSLLLLPFVCGIVALLWVPFTFEVQFILDDESTHFAFYWRVFGLGISLTPMVRFVGRNTIARIHKALPRPDAVKPRELLSKLRDLAQGVRTQGRSMARTAHLFAREIVSFRLHLALGLADPFLTATACGGAWAVLGPVFGALQSSVTFLSPPGITVSPQHDSLGVGLSVHCIFRFRLGQIIRDAIRSLASSVL